MMNDSNREFSALKSKTILSGIAGLLQSTKGVLALLVIGISAFALLQGKLGGMEFAAIVSTITTFFGYHRVAESRIASGG